MKIRYKFKKLMVFIKRKKEKKLELDEMQKKAFDLIIKIINSQNSNLIYDPEKFRRGIEIGDLFVIINRNRVIFTNKSFNNSISIDDSIFDIIVSKFDAKLTRKFNTIENRSIQKIKDNLDFINQNI